MIEIRYAQGPDIVTIWDKMLPFFVKLTNHDITYSIEQAFDELYNKEALAWLVYNDDELIAMLVSKNVEYSGVPITRAVVMAGRDWELWGQQMHDMLVQYIEQEKRVGLQAFCRPGISKWLDDLGWNKSHVVMEYKKDG